MSKSLGSRIAKFLLRTASILVPPLVIAFSLSILLILAIYLVDSISDRAGQQAYFDAVGRALQPELAVDGPLARDLDRALKQPIGSLANSILSVNDEGEATPQALIDNNLKIDRNWSDVLMEQKVRPSVVWGGKSGWPSLQGSFSKYFHETLLFPTVTKPQSLANGQHCSLKLSKTDVMALDLDSQCQLPGRAEIQNLLVGLRAAISNAAKYHPCDVNDYACHYAVFQAAFGSRMPRGSLIRDALFVRRVYMYVAQGSRRGVLVLYPGARPFCTGNSASCDTQYKPTQRPWYKAIYPYAENSANCASNGAGSSGNCILDISVEGHMQPCVLTAPYADVAATGVMPRLYPTVRTLSCFLGKPSEALAQESYPNIYLMLDLEPLKLATRQIAVWWQCVGLGHQTYLSHEGARTVCNSREFERIPANWLTGQDIISARKVFNGDWSIPRVLEEGVATLSSTYHRHSSLIAEADGILFGVILLGYFILHLVPEDSVVLYVRNLLPPCLPSEEEPFQFAKAEVARRLKTEKAIQAKFDRAIAFITLRGAISMSVERTEAVVKELHVKAEGWHRRLRAGHLISVFAIEWRIYHGKSVRWRNSGRSVNLWLGLMGASELVGIQPRGAVPILHQLEKLGKSIDSTALETLRDRYPRHFDELLGVIMLGVPPDHFVKVSTDDGISASGRLDRRRAMPRIDPFKRVESSIVGYSSGQYRSKDLLGVIESAQESFPETYHMESVVAGSILKALLSSVLLSEAKYRSVIETWLESGDETDRIVVVDSEDSVDRIAQGLGFLQDRRGMRDFTGRLKWLPEQRLKNEGMLGVAFRDFALIRNGAIYEYCLVTTRVFVRDEIEVFEAVAGERAINFEGYASVREHEIRYAKDIFASLWALAFDRSDDAVSWMRGQASTTTGTAA